MNVKNVERKIANIEGFDVSICHSDGSNARSDKQGLPTYPYSNAAINTWTVAQWKDERFRRAYPGYQVRVWETDGNEAHGKMHLTNLLEGYMED